MKSNIIRMHKTGKASTTAVFILLFLFFLTNNNAAFSQAKGKKTDNKKTATTAEKKKDEKEGEEKSEFIEKYSPWVGIIGGISKPTGDLSSALGMGFGGQLTAGLKLPINISKTLQFRGKLSAGYYSLPGSGDFGGTLTSIPAIITFEISYPTISGFRPYFGLGGGITYDAINGDSGADSIPNDSSIDGSLAFTLGAGYTVRSMPHIEYLVDIRYLIAFETVIGQFVNISAGVSYNFNSPWGWMEKEKKNK